MNTRTISEAKLPTRFGDFRILGLIVEPYEENIYALVMGDPKSKSNPLVRIHIQCVTGEIFASSACDCGDQLEASLRMIAEESHGIIIYRPAKEGKSRLLDNLETSGTNGEPRKSANKNHQIGLDTPDTTYSLWGSVLKHFGLNQIRLMSNNPINTGSLKAAGLSRITCIPVETSPPPKHGTELKTKDTKLSHLLSKLSKA